jgi:hypothetical protein
MAPRYTPKVTGFVESASWSLNGGSNTHHLLVSGRGEAAVLEAPARKSRYQTAAGVRTPTFRHVAAVRHLRCTQEAGPGSRWNASSGASRPADDRFAVRDSNVVEIPGRTLSVSELKSELLRSVAEQNRGLASTSSSRKETLELVRALEREQAQGSSPSTTIAAPCNLGWAEQASKVSGDWKLLFTTALDVLLLGWSVLPFTPQVGSIYQNIRVALSADAMEFTLENVVQFAAPASFLLAQFGIEDSDATLRVLARGQCDRSRPQRLYLRFERARLEPNRFLGRRIDETLPPLQLPLRGTAVGWTELTFLDEDLRIIRTAVNDVFVLWRV